MPRALWCGLLLIACARVEPASADPGSKAQTAVLPPGEEFVETFRGPTEEEAKAEPLLPDEESRSEYSAEELREYEQITRFHRGEAADLDGDGRKEAVGRWVNGVFTFAIDENGDGTPDNTSDGTREVDDSDYDGRPNMIVTTTVRPNGGLKVVRERDKDGDGTMDERYTTERLTSTTERRLMERRDDPNGEYRVVYDRVASLTNLHLARTPTSNLSSSEQEACIDEFPQRFPKDISAPVYGTKGVIIPYGRAALGRCTSDQGKKVRKALSCVKDKALTCLSTLNPALARRLSKFLQWRDQATKAVISCSGTCDVGGITRNDFGVGNSEIQAIELPSGILNVPDTMACEFLLHELLHAMKEEPAADHDSNGNDQIYSCSRVCSGCSHSSVGAGDDHRDCAVCGEPVANKQSCGWKALAEGSIGTDPKGCVKRVKDEVLFSPGSARLVTVYNCDDTRSMAHQSACIQNCPEGYIAGAYCSAFDAGDTNLCTEAHNPLSFCHQG